MPITFSLRSVAWLGVDPANLKNPSGSPAPRHSAPLVYEGKAADEIQYLVHGCPQVSMVRAVKGDNDTATFYGPAGEVLYSAAGGWGFDLADLTDDGAKVFDAVSTARIAFATERAAGRLR
jgi:hypothetical protein